MTPEVNDTVWALRPDFIALSIVVRGGRNAESGAAGAAATASTLVRPEWADAHLASWREAYKAFGAKPQRTPCSAEALWRRIERDGTIAPVNAVVDLYNTISLRFAVPVGGEDLAKYSGIPRLLRASGDEPFDTTRDGQVVTENADRGEVIWRDDVGVTCRRWNWRQTPRTRLDLHTTDMWFVLERLEPMPIEKLEEAGQALVDGLTRIAPTCSIERQLLKR